MHTFVENQILSQLCAFSHMKHLLNDKDIQHSTNKTKLQTSYQIESVLHFSQIVECEESFVGFLFGFEIIL